MQWPTAEVMTRVCPPAEGYHYEVLRKEVVPELIAALGAWQPGWSVGAASLYLRESFYENSVFFERGAPDRDVFVMLIRHGDELVGMLSQERVVDALSLYAALVVLAPAHRGSKSLFQGEYLEEMAKLMSLEFIYTLATLKHRGAQRYFESHGYELVGFMPGYDREEVSPGVVKRVVEAAYVKCLSGTESILAPDVANMTSTVRRLYEAMYSEPRASSSA